MTVLQFITLTIWVLFVVPFGVVVLVMQWKQRKQEKIDAAASAAVFGIIGDVRDRRKKNDRAREAAERRRPSYLRTGEYPMTDPDAQDYPDEGGVPQAS